MIMIVKFKKLNEPTLISLLAFTLENILAIYGISCLFIDFTQTIKLNAALLNCCTALKYLKAICFKFAVAFLSVSSLDAHCEKKAIKAFKYLHTHTKAQTNKYPHFSHIRPPSFHSACGTEASFMLICK